MSKQKSQHNQETNPETGSPADVAGQGETSERPDLSSLKQVRDILVGPLSSEIDATMRKLDLRLDQSMTEFSETTTKRVDSVEARFMDEFERLNVELGSRHEDGQVEIGRLERETLSSFENLQQSLKELTGDVSKARESFRDELDKMHRQVDQLVESVSSRLDDECRRLREELVDRSSLSAALSEVALRLAGPAGALHGGDPNQPDIDIDHLLDG